MNQREINLAFIKHISWKKMIVGLTESTEQKQNCIMSKFIKVNLEKLGVNH